MQLSHLIGKLIQNVIIRNPCEINFTVFHEILNDIFLFPFKREMLDFLSF